MAKRGKKYREAASKVDRNKMYDLKSAVALAQEVSTSKFAGSLDLVIALGVDPRHADQNVRGATPLPKGSGKSVRIVVFAKGEKATEAEALGVEMVGGDDLAKKITDGWLDFDQVIATPDMMGVVGRLGRTLGPRGLMPNPKLGTVTMDVKKAVDELNAGRAEFRVDKAGIVHCSVGRTNMTTDDLTENAEAVVQALLKAKPASAKGNYLKKIFVTPTMGPSVPVDITIYKP
jgi:large subunit ribosomal protein L1